MLHKHLTRRTNDRIAHQNRDIIKETWKNVFKELGSLKKKVGIIEDTDTIFGPGNTADSPTKQQQDIEQKLGHILVSLAESLATITDYTINLSDKVEATEDTHTQQVDASVTITNTLHELNNKVDRVEEGQRETSDKLIVSFDKVLETMRESIDAGRALGQRVAELKLEDMAEKREMLNLIIELNQRIEVLEDR